MLGREKIYTLFINRLFIVFLRHKETGIVYANGSGMACLVFVVMRKIASGSWLLAAGH